MFAWASFGKAMDLIWNSTKADLQRHSHSFIFLHFLVRFRGCLEKPLNSKISCISTSFKKEISILSHITKSYESGNFCKAACPKKYLNQKLLFLDIFPFLLFRVFQKLFAISHNKATISNINPIIDIKVLEILSNYLYNY